MDTSLMMVGVSFNSKLVRLEASFIVSIRSCITLFQFQTGSIRRLRKSLLIYYNGKVSIPNWFD